MASLSLLSSLMMMARASGFAPYNNTEYRLVDWQLQPDLFTEPDTDSQGLHVEARVEEAAHLEQGLEGVPRLHQALAAPGLVSRLVAAHLGHLL